MGAAWADVLWAALWGGLATLERRAFLQAMLSRPLVAATVMGLLIGDVNAGLFTGLVLELFYLGAASLGAAVPDHDTLAATGTAAAAAAMAQATGGGSTPAMWSLALLLFLPLGRLGRWLDRVLAGYTTRLATRARAAAESGNLARAVRQNLWGMWPHFLGFGAITGACAAAGWWLGPHESQLPLPALRGLAWAYPAMGSVAAAIAAQGSHARRGSLWGALGGAVVAGLVLLSIVLGDGL